MAAHARCVKLNGNKRRWVMYSTASVYKYKTTRVFSPWLKKVKYKQLFKSKLPKDPVYSPFICPSYTTNPPSLTTPHDQPSPHTKRTNTIFAPLSQNPLQTHDLQNDAVSSRHHPRNNMTTCIVVITRHPRPFRLHARATRK
jgi:hypothetical protein